jgi:glucokinase
MNLAIDAGGTNLRAQIWQNDTLVKSLSAKSKEIGLLTWLESILKEYKDIKTVGIAYAGQVEDGYIISSPNIAIDEQNIQQVIQKRYNISLKIQNDLNCAILAESKAQKSENICAIYLGTGLGLGVMDNSKVVSGQHNMATELGHIPYKQTEFVCGCGRSNCIELFCSGSALQRWVGHKALKCEPTLQKIKKCGGLDVIEMFEEALLYAVGTTISLFNPQVLVLGGGIVDANPYLNDMINKRIHNYALPQALKDLKISQSTLDNAAIIGAKKLKDYNG